VDKKYAGKALVMNKTTTAIVLEVQATLATQLGFRPSISDTVAHLATEWRQRHASMYPARTIAACDLRHAAPACDDPRCRWVDKPRE
jgi:hypothetical protein